MPFKSIKFSSGLNRKAGAPDTSPYDMEDCFIAPFNEVHAWINGSNSSTLTDLWIPRGKPWFYFSNRWFDGDVFDDFFKFRNRAYLTAIEGTDDQAEVFTTQIIDGVTPVDSFYQQRFVRYLYYNNLFENLVTLHSTSEVTYQGSSTLGTTVKGWAADDTGIQGITNQRAVDYIFVPLDRYGQAGPWIHKTILIDRDTSSGVDTISGSDVFTVIPQFNFGVLLSNFSADATAIAETGYEKVAVYRTIEYDLNGYTTASGASEAEFSPGGYFLEAITGDEIYRSTSYWPFDIQKEASTLTDQLGPVIDRSRNHWQNTLNKRATNLAAKAVHMDRGVAVYGNVAVPTKKTWPAIRAPRAESEITATFATGPNTITRASGDFITDGFDVGDNVYIYNAATASNNKKVTVTNVTSTVLTVTETLTAEGPTSNVTVFNAPTTAFIYKYIKDDNTTVISRAGAEGTGLDHVQYNDKKMVVPYNGSEDGLRVYVKFTPDIVSIDSAGDSITIRGDWTDFFAARLTNNADQVTVTGTAFNDGVFTITPGTVATNVTPETGGELTIDSDAKTFTRSTGSWVTDGYAIGMTVAFVAFSPNYGFYTVSAVTATTLTLNEEPRLTQTFTEGTDYAIGGQTVALSGTNTVLPVTEDILSSEGAVGNVEFWVLWEDINLDSDGRYKSSKQKDGMYWTFNGTLSDDFSFLESRDYHDRTVLADLPTGVNVVLQPSKFYLSEVNAPWEITMDSGIVPDSSEIIAISPSRIEESEQLTSYEFYIFTETHVYVAERQGKSVALTAVESTVGATRGNNDQALVEPVKGGVVFYGTDRNLYYISGRQMTKLNYEVDDIVTGVQDIGYDPVQDYLYVMAEGIKGIFVYDFNRNMWIGQKRISASFEEGNVEINFEGNLDDTSIVGDVVGSKLTLSDTFIIDQTDFKFYSENSPSIGIRLALKVDRISPPGTDTIAVVEQSLLATPGNAWTVISGDILSGDVTISSGEQIYCDVDTLPTFMIGGEFRLKIKGVSEDPATVAGSMTTRSIGYNPNTFNMTSSWIQGDNRVVLLEDHDDSGEVRNFPEVRTQEFDSAFTRTVEHVRVNYEGKEFSSTASWTAGGTAITNLNTGDQFNAGLDPVSVIKLAGAGLDVDGDPADLIVFIASVAGSVATVSDPVANTTASSNINWRRPAEMKIFLLNNGMYRDREIGNIPIISNRPYYVKNHEDHRLRIEVSDFDKLHEILIFITDKIDSD